ncbi:MAG: site-specific DNA-methyltransferase [Fimbriimonadaceae bacterium]|nr:site-specific DNA-methyltransferase [Fimbriimonadaceae bacterium]
MSKQKLELTWVGKDVRPRLEPRILLEDANLSYHAAERVGEGDLFDNRLIFGDNLLALKALEQEFAGKVKCIFIDPPYNTGSAFTHYDDGLEHSIWLGMMRDRLELLRSLLAEDGSLWVTLDDNEAHYFKVMADEVFGRANFEFTFIWRNVDSPNDNKVPVTSTHNFVLCYARDIKKLALRPLEDPSIVDAYPLIDERTGERCRDRLLKKNGRNSLRTDRPTMFFPVKGPDGVDVWPIHDDGREARWACGQDKVALHRENGTLIWKQRDKNGAMAWVPYTREFAPENPTKPYPTIWGDLDTMRQTKAHLKDVLPGIPEFATPKPEDVIARILNMATEKDDLVLDSFAGSGTTGAVAHKMGRRWIMVELGEHCHTHIIPRLKKVIDGDDPGGITKAVGWKGGGGFRYFKLAPSLIQKDQYGNDVINPAYNAEMLAEAMCKFMGFRYSPSDLVFWQHGQSSENDFIYVTTQPLTVAYLRYLSEEVGPERSLLVCCTAFKGSPDAFDNLTVKKIPKTVLGRCEFGKDDYSLQVANLPQAKPEVVPQPALFGEEEA